MHEQDEAPDNSAPSLSRTNQRTFRLSVAASIVASIIVRIFIQPILAFLSDIIVSSITFPYKGYIDGLYEQAAASTISAAVFQLLTFITVFPAGVATGLITTIYIMPLLPSFRHKSLVLRNTMLTRVFVLLSALFIPALFVMNFSFYVSFQATATFEQRLMALAPVISDDERKSLFAKWALMKGRTDYDKINTIFEELAQKYHAELPRPFI